MSFRERLAIHRRNSRWAYICRAAIWAPIGTSENDIIAGRLTSELQSYIRIEVANQQPFDHVVSFDDLAYAIRARAFVLRAARNPQATSAATRDLLWPAGEENDTRFDVSLRYEKGLLGFALVDLLAVLPTTPAAEVFDTTLYRTRAVTCSTTSDLAEWARHAALSERYTEEIRSNWGDLLAFCDSADPRGLETALGACELGVMLAVIQRVADAERAIEMVRHAPAPVAVVALAMLTPDREDVSRPPRSLEDAYEAFNSGKPDASTLLQRALAARADTRETEVGLWNNVVAALSTRRDLSAPLAVLGSNADHPTARSGFEEAVAAYSDAELCSAVDAVHQRDGRTADELMLLRRVAVKSGGEQALEKIHEIGKALGKSEGVWRLFDPVDVGRSGVDLYLNGVASDAVQDLGRAMRALATLVDATSQLLRGRYVEITRDAKNGALAQVLAVLSGLVWAHQHESLAIKSAAPNQVSALTVLVEYTERLLEWFDSLDVSEHLMPKLFDSISELGDARLIDRLRGTLRAAFCVGETIQSWPVWLPQSGGARMQLVRGFHQDVLHDHAAYFVGTHRFDLNSTPDALRPFLEVDCQACERLIIERIAQLPNKHSNLRAFCLAALTQMTSDAIRYATTLRSYPLVHEPWRRFRDALVAAVQRLVPEVATTEAPTAWVRRFEAGLLDRTSLLASEVAR